MRISVIIATTDDAVFVDEAIASIPRHRGGPVERIVVHDGSDAFVQGLTARHPDLRIVKGTGQGASAAYNLGIGAAGGDFVVFLSSDDRLRPDVFERLGDCAGRRPDIRIWTGGTRIFRDDESGGQFVIRTLRDPRKTALTLANVLDDLPLWNARIYHRAVFEEIGRLDVAYSLCSDREFLARAIVAGVPEAPLGAMTYEYRMHPGSATMTDSGQPQLRYLRQHVELAETWMTREGIPTEVRNFFRRWHGREAARLAYHHMRAGQWSPAGVTLLRTSLRHPGWWLWAPTAVTASRRRSRVGGEGP